MLDGIPTTDRIMATSEGFDASINEQVQELSKVCTTQVAPLCAVLGGLLGNGIIKVISGKGEPASNTMLFNG